ncbi:MAG: putative beta-barrel assembly-enhancing protease [Porticoccaceae bacterium]|nr:MAG: putative beta-barrel assembly-enhancing protease [Porticoccaceae bacterium]
MRRTLLLLAALCLAAPAGAALPDLPELGDTSSAILSPRQEELLGRAWLGAFRARVKTLDDPELTAYLEELLGELKGPAGLGESELTLVLVNNPALNAFAVPGGVVGVHTGLFRYAEDEDELAAVLAHELAHLRQRHFARRLEAGRANAVTALAGMLAGLVLAATVGGDAGMAAITMGQAAALESNLRYSREHEQEADRLGLEILKRTGRDPAAVPRMFERMLAATRYTGSRPPEYLLTHPLTERRLADARARLHALGEPPHRPHSERYAFLRARALLWLDGNLLESVRRFRAELAASGGDAARYGLALALSGNGEHAAAARELAPLLAARPADLTLRLAAVELAYNRGDSREALALVESLAAEHPGYYPCERYRAKILLRLGRTGEAQAVLERLSRARPADPQVWFELAETAGLAGDILGVHRARAQYFRLTGAYDEARKQLLYAKRLAAADRRETALLEEALREVEEEAKRARELL